MELYKRIKIRREELGMSQQELATKIGYKSRSSINKIELGENDIPQSKIIAFARALETTPEYLMGFDTEPNYAELDIFEEILALIGWNYEVLSNCDGLYINEYLDDNDKIQCRGTKSPDVCKNCVHSQPYYYLTDGYKYYKLSKEEFDNLSSCLVPYLQIRINEVINKKIGLSEHDYQVAEGLIEEPCCKPVLNAASERPDATEEDKIRTNAIMTNDSEWG